MPKAKKITTKTNNAGGILGGISNGNEIVMRMVVKPTSSINREQDTVTQKGKKPKSGSKAGMIPASLPVLCPWPKPWSRWF